MTDNIKVPWGDGTPWNNSASFFTYLRGCLRSAWSRNPIKHNLIKKKRYQISNPNKSGKKPTVWGALCSVCKGEFPLSYIQVDHKNPAGSLRKREDIQGFVERLLFVCEDDLRLVCKECNSCLAMADKQGISLAKARATKFVIQMEKDKSIIDFLLSNHYTDNSIGRNAKQRRQQAIEILMSQGEDNV